MKNILKCLLIILVIALVIALIVTTVLYIAPNANIKRYREKLEVQNSETLEKKDCIHFLNTDSSDAILIESDGHFALVDCGEDSDNPRGFEELVYKGYEDEILDYLKRNATATDGKVHLDFVLGTHSHSDHIGGFDTIIEDDDVIIDRAYLKVYDESKINDHEVEKWDNKEVYEQMVNALNQKNIPIISDITEKTFMLGNFTITLFNTEYDNSGIIVGENDNSIGTLIEKNGARVFLAADIDNINGDEDRIGKELGKIDLLKVGHHSYSKSTSAGWLKNLDPDVCVVTNLYEKTDKRTLRRITRIAKAPILTTGGENGVIASIDDDGTITYYNNNDIH